MNPCEYTMLVSTIACSIAQDRSEEEVELLAAFFSQLGDSLATFITYKAVCCCKNDEDGKEKGEKGKEEDFIRKIL